MNDKYILINPPKPLPVDAFQWVGNPQILSQIEPFVISVNERGLVNVKFDINKKGDLIINYQDTLGQVIKPIEPGSYLVFSVGGVRFIGREDFESVYISASI